MKKLISKVAKAAIIFIGLININTAQAQDSVMIRQVALQNNFVNKIKAAGYMPSLPAPQIVLDNPLSFGNYNDKKNILETCDWKTMPEDTKGLFVQAAKSFNNGITAEQLFERGTQKWVFIHEMGHWWRKCQKQKALPYDEEVGANRLAIAYWREQDPAFFNFMLNWFQGMADHMPNPVPAGEDKRKYLNDNYNNMAGNPSYTWFQATMIIDASKEMPVLTFAQAVAKAGN